MLTGVETILITFFFNPVKRMEKLTKEYTVEPDEQGQRLDKYLAVRLGGEYSRQKIQDYIKEGEVFVDGTQQTVPKFAVQAGSVVVIQVPVLARRLEGADVPFDVLYHDEDMALVNKPAGLVVHPEPSAALLSEGPATLAHGLVKRFPELGDVDDLRPGIVHRLDKDTSGLLLAGLTEEGREYLEDLFAARAMHKEYLALVHGVPEEAEGEICLPIGRHPVKKINMAVVADGKEALSHYKVVFASEDRRFSVLAVSIITGRTHQIRVHLSAIGHPIIGDGLYTEGGYRLEGDAGILSTAPSLRGPVATPLAALRKKKTDLCDSSGEAHALWVPSAKRQMLHAWKLAFPYEPETIIDQGPQVMVEDGWLVAVCPPPSDFLNTLTTLLHRPLRLVVTGLPGSGKSSFSRYFTAFGVPVFSADSCVAELYGPDGDGTRVLSMRFGDTYVTKSGVDKRALGEAMRHSGSLRREVEDMIHPLVYHALEAFWRDNAAQPLLMAEIPLFFESEAHPVDRVIGVSCPFAVRAQRLHHNRGWSDDIIRDMETWQLSEKEKMERCDIIVPNDGSVEDLREKAQKTYEVLMASYHKQVESKLAEIVALWENLPLLEI